MNENVNAFREKLNDEALKSEFDSLLESLENEILSDENVNAFREKLNDEALKSEFDSLLESLKAEQNTQKDTAQPDLQESEKQKDPQSPHIEPLPQFQSPLIDTKEVEKREKKSFKDALSEALNDNVFWLEQIKMTLLSVNELYKNFEKLEQHYQYDFKSHELIKTQTQSLYDEALNIFSQLQTQNEALNEKIATHTQDLVQTKESLVQSQNQALALIEEIKHINKETKESAGEVIVFKNTIQEAINRLDEVIETNAALEQSITEGRELVQSAKDDLNNTIKQGQDDLNNTIKQGQDDLNNTIKQGQDDLNAVKENLETFKQEKINEIDAALNEIETRRDAAMNAFDNAKADYEHRLEDFAKRIDAYLPNDSDEQELLISANNALQSAQNALNALLDELMELYNQNAVLTHNAEDLKKNYDETYKHSLQIYNMKNDCISKLALCVETNALLESFKETLNDEALRFEFDALVRLILDNVKGEDNE
ncbi:hypothetical protein [Campylobacter cuniculorum]|uniref:Uncharacterized protein n=2 Tax=Campylobacter cuniculorum TaxID=374106 RepID=A0A1W6BV25_9BACT|nr:hypothetical protein [Campylobacter cuniculorum]ARJ55911.1 hypothetical protein, putative segregation protein [Campylobacter cuniculorum DSM 23162 = LMG 24588]QOR05129.1 hypothetical protein A0071_04150 [Campylobacter cuniculorum]